MVAAFQGTMGRTDTGTSWNCTPKCIITVSVGKGAEYEINQNTRSRGTGTLS